MEVRSAGCLVSEAFLCRFERLLQLQRLSHSSVEEKFQSELARNDEKFGWNTSYEQWNTRDYKAP